MIKKSHNFSIAIDSKEGLTVPNIKDIQNKSIIAINEEIGVLREKTDKG